MTCRFATETYAQWRADAAPLLHSHYEEVAVGNAPMDVDDAQFEWMCRSGMLHVVTVRDDGRLVGYHISIVRRHLHRAVLSAYTDAFYLHPEFRGGRTAYRMFQYATDTLVRRGVRQVYSGTKLNRDIGRMLEHQGFKHVENTYLKVIA
jgi:GNAT superfamily N-acetyltransferase